MVNKLMKIFPEIQFVLLVAAILLGVAAMAAPARAGSSVNVTSNPVQGSPYEVQENQDSTLTYKLTYSIGADAEGNTPSLSSITLTFSANNGGTIQESGSSTWTETLTKNLSSPMTVSCEAFGPANGNYSVTCEATLNLSDGTTASGGPASDTFLVALMTVNVSGPPYVIIDNSNPYDNSPVVSTYTASVPGAPDPSNIVYEWIVSSNINSLRTPSDAPNSLPVDGASPEGGGVITCAAFSDGSNQPVSKQVTVQNEFVATMDTPATLVYGTWTELSPTQTEPLGGGVPLSWTVTGSVSGTIGVTVTGGFNAGLVAAQISGTVATTVTQSISATATVSNPVPGQEYAEWGRTKRDELTGTETQWGTGGIVKTGQITEWSWANGDYNLEIGGGNTPPPS